MDIVDPRKLLTSYAPNRHKSIYVDMLERTRYARYRSKQTMSKRRNTIYVALLGLCAGMSATPAHCSESGWLIRQQSPYSTYSGNQNVFLTKTRLKMEGSNVRVFYEVKSRILEAYNVSTKEYFSSPVDNWIKKYATLPKEKFVEPTKKTLSIAGMTSQLFYLSRNESEGVHHLREIWATQKIAVPSDLCRVMWAMCGLTPAPGVPMRVNRLLGRDKTELLLDTIQVSKANFEAKDFARPKGFKRVKSELELLLHSSSDGGSLSDMLGK